jgi:hypothetical protein
VGRNGHSKTNWATNLFKNLFLSKKLMFIEEKFVALKSSDVRVYQKFSALGSSYPLKKIVGQ